METLNIVYDFVKIFAGVYAFIAIAILIYGIKSFFTGKSRIYNDSSSSYRLQPGGISSLSVSRIIPYGNEPAEGDTAKTMGCVYILVGSLMLAPLVWVAISLFSRK